MRAETQCCTSKLISSRGSSFPDAVDKDERSDESSPASCTPVWGVAEHDADSLTIHTENLWQASRHIAPLMSIENPATTFNREGGPHRGVDTQRLIRRQSRPGLQRP
jgi:hypothetical protein